MEEQIPERVIPTRMVNNPPSENNTIQQEKSAEDKLFEFVDKQITKFRKYATFTNGQPSFFELNETLSSYADMNCSLLVIYVKAKEEYQKAKDEYDDFIADKYKIIREEYNLPSLSAQKWLSTQEIMTMIQSDNRWRDEYKKLRENLHITEMQRDFCRRLLDNLVDLKFNLGTLSKNVQAEVLSLNPRVPMSDL